MFVSFEGIDGSGKSTQVSLLVDRLESAGYECVSIREPGGTPLSERIREILLDPGHEVAPFSELLLYSAARHQLCANVIRPALEAGRIVICDRFTDSTLAYQGGGRGVADQEWLRTFNERVTGGLVPDRTFYLAVGQHHAQARLRQRLENSRTEEDRLEGTGEAFFMRVVEAYERIHNEESERVLRLDARAGIDELHETIWSDVSALIEQQPSSVSR